MPLHSADKARLHHRENCDGRNHHVAILRRHLGRFGTRSALSAGVKAWRRHTARAICRFRPPHCRSTELAALHPQYAERTGARASSLSKSREPGHGGRARVCHSQKLAPAKGRAGGSQAWRRHLPPGGGARRGGRGGAAGEVAVEGEAEVEGGSQVNRPPPRPGQRTHGRTGADSGLEAQPEEWSRCWDVHLSFSGR